MINLNNIKSLQDLHFEMEPAMEEVLSAEDLAMTQMILDTLDEIEELQEQQEMEELEKLYLEIQQTKQKQIDDNTKTKICSCCGKELLYRDFHNRKSSADGKSNKCKECTKQSRIDSQIKKLEQEKQQEQQELEQELLEHELKVALIQIEELSKPNNDECGINGIQKYFTTEKGYQIEFDDDMDEFDRRNVQRFLDVRLEE